ncbi:MAG: alpha/beta fold hydrolase, partial [Myxococcota bacterium]
MLLHGLLGSRRNLAVLARDLVRARSDLLLVLADLTGHGASPPLPASADLSVLAGDVLALADHLNLPSPIRIIGHSLGARIALKALALRPYGVEAVGLLDMAPGPLDSPLAGDGVMQRLQEAPERFPTRRAASDHFISRGLSRPMANWLAMNL